MVIDAAALLVLSITLALIAVIHVLFVRIVRLEREVRALNAQSSPRHSHRTSAGIEDALAVNIDLVRLAHEARIEMAIVEMRAAQQAEILKLVRQGPQAYEEDRPCGHRPQEGGACNEIN